MFDEVKAYQKLCLLWATRYTLAADNEVGCKIIIGLLLS